MGVFRYLLVFMGMGEVRQLIEGLGNIFSLLIGDFALVSLGTTESEGGVHLGQLRAEGRTL